MPNLEHYRQFSLATALAHFSIEISPIYCRDLVNDSREIIAGDIFTAVAGTYSNGNKFIDAAIENGALVVIAEVDAQEQHGNIEIVKHGTRQIQIIGFYKLGERLAQVSAYYYGEPLNNIQLTGITGTNGKTSCCQLVAQLQDALAKQTAMIGTLGAGRIGALVDFNNTTPGPTKLQQLLASFSAENIGHVVMEVSSHALSQHRVDSVMVDIAVFTNLSRDHLDFHGDMESYASAKQQLFTGNEQQIWVLNADDALTSTWLTQLPKTNRRVLFSCSDDSTCQSLVEQSLAQMSDYLIAKNIRCHNKGVTFELLSSWGNIEINSSLLGHFNVSNLLAAMSVLLVQDIDLKSIAKYTNQLSPVAGRMEVFSDESHASAIIDYAHTPDGLEQALKAVKQHCTGNIWLVFGCGGDRDTGKRPIMGNIAEQFADHIVVTNDNPRTESPESIVDDILAGFNSTEKVNVILDRETAVLHALQHAKQNDMVLCAGKGHEDYTIMGTDKISYHERDIVSQFYGQGAIS